MKPTIDDMINFIEQKVCIREIWRCAAGWGMLTIELARVDEHRKQMSDYYTQVYGSPQSNDLTRRQPPPEPAAIVQNYYPSLEECVRAEYKRFCS